MNLLERELEKTHSEWRRLEHQWGKTSEKWKDKNKHLFENHFWQRFEDETPTFIKCLEKTTDAISRVCRDMGIRI